jgi:hypothetical protein
MKVSFSTLLSLRTWVLALWMLLWTGSVLGSMLINGMGTKLTHGPGRWVAVAALAGTAVAALGLCVSERVRAAMLEPSRREHFDPQLFVFVGLLTAALAVSFALAPGRTM